MYSSKLSISDVYRTPGFASMPLVDCSCSTHIILQLALLASLWVPDRSVMTL